jgi:DNA-binding CsgD family transcriptional regulator
LDPSGLSLLEFLTKSKYEIARLVAQGLSYKEIARIRGRSFSTIDHHLRSIRHKTGVSSTSALVSLLAKNEALNG